MPHGGGMVTLPVGDTRADDDPSSRGRPSHSSSRSHVQPLPCRFRARLPHYANDRGRSFAPLGLLLFRNRSEPTRVQFVGAQRRDHRQAASVSAVARKSVILDGTSTTTCRGCMSEHRRQEPIWTSVRGAGVKAVSPAERGRGAKRRALTSVSTRARCWLDDAAGDHNILRSTRVQFLSV